MFRHLKFEEERRTAIIELVGLTHYQLVSRCSERSIEFFWDGIEALQSPRAIEELNKEIQVDREGGVNIKQKIEYLLIAIVERLEEDVELDEGLIGLLFVIEFG